jgi:hypothetical protein
MRARVRPHYGAVDVASLSVADGRGVVVGGGRRGAGGGLAARPDAATMDLKCSGVTQIVPTQSLPNVAASEIVLEAVREPVLVLVKGPVRCWWRRSSVRSGPTSQLARHP